MGRHSVGGVKLKLAPTLVLGLTVLSVGSPLVLLTNIPVKAQGEEIKAFAALPTGDTSLDTVTAAQTPDLTAREEATSTTSRPPNRRSTTSRPPTSRPTPAVSTHPRPTVAQRQIQRSATPTPTTVQRRALPSPTPQPQIAKRTTTTTRPQARTGTSTATATATTVRTTTPPPRTTTKATPKPTPTATATEPPHQASSRGDRIVAVAKTYVGRNLPYRYGGDSLTTGIDCSHFIHRVLKEAGLSVPYRSSGALASWTTRTTNPQPGDLVLYNGHAGIYAGNGMMVHHGKPGGAFFIKVYTNNLIGYGRIPL